jgi:arylsulfatase A-like enzyme
VRELKARGLIDDTIVVVTGDHGEQFGQHGRLAHGWSLYEEEVRVPLLIYNPHLFPNEKNVTRISRQIDIAPTLLGLLGFDPPLQWQGNDSFDADYPSRVYLFSEFVFGMAEGNLKYIYDAEKGGNVELYDLSRDPDERNNLVGDSAYSRQTKDAYERITAWSSFQNRYLDKFTPADKPRVTAGGKTSRDLAGSTQLDQNRTGN